MNITNAESFDITKYGSVFITGEIGTGKHYLFHKLVDHYMSKMGPNQVKFAIFDMKYVDFYEYDEGTKKDYIYKDIERGGEPNYGFDRLEELANLSIEKVKQASPAPLLVVYLEECDMAACCGKQDYFDKLVTTIINNADKANMKLIYSTSNPRPDTISKQLLHSFDLTLVGGVSSWDDSRFEWLEIKKIEIRKDYDFAVIDNRQR